MGPLAPKLEETFTYGGYLRWDDGDRRELIDGVAYNMSPAPAGISEALVIDLKAVFAE